MNYTIVEYNEAHHTLVVEYKNQRITIAIPVVDKAYIVGADLEKFIIAVLTNHLRIQENSNGVTNKDEIRKLVKVQPQVQAAPVVEMTTQEKLDIIAFAAKHDKIELIKQTDWTQLPDAGLSKKDYSAWTEYRRSLRNINKQEGYPLDITWPIPPGSILKKNVNKVNPDGTLESKMGKWNQAVRESLLK